MSDSGFFFTGTQTAPIPVAILDDHRLTPTDIKAWMVLRSLTMRPGESARYTDLEYRLFTGPFSDKASRETVANCITALRITRWISAIHRGREPGTGKMLPNKYAVHEEPLSVQEARQIDFDYEKLVQKSLNHASRIISHLASLALKDLVETDSSIAPRTHIEVLNERCKGLSGPDTQPPPKYEFGRKSTVRLPNSEIKPSSATEQGRKNPVRNPVRQPNKVKTLSSEPSSATEPLRKATEINGVRQPNHYSTVRNTYVCTVLYKRSDGQTAQGELNWPASLDRFILADEKPHALTALQHLSLEMQEQALHELCFRCETTNIKKPIGYLKGIINKIAKGEFCLNSVSASGSALGNLPENKPVVPLFETGSTERFNPRGTQAFNELENMFKPSKHSKSNLTANNLVS